MNVKHDIIDSMRPFATSSCENCGEFVLIEPSDVSIFMYGEKDGIAVTICPYCNRSVVTPVHEDDYTFFYANGVRFFSWVDGTTIKMEKDDE